jgi:chromosome segregation ATPase
VTGGVNVNKERSLNFDSLQLQQMIIFLKSEIAKYKNEVEQLQQTDYYSLALTLEQENFELKKQQREFSLELLKMRRKLQKEIKTFQVETRTYMDKRAKLTSSIQRLVTEKNQLKATNEHLLASLNTMQRKIQLSEKSAHLFTSEYRQSFEQPLLNFIEQASEQLQSIQEQINRQYNEVATTKQDILFHINQEGEHIKRLVNELKKAREEQEAIQSQEVGIKNISTLPHIENQIQIIHNKTKLFEKQLEEKLQMLHTFEEKLNQLANEMNKND